MKTKLLLVLAAFAVLSQSVRAAELPVVGQTGPVDRTWLAPNFRFHDGEIFPSLMLHATTLGDPTNPAVLILHGTGGSGAALLAPGFGGQLFGPGQPLDATRNYIILPDALGAGQSAKPSDGMRAAFPHYDYDDMVLAQYRLVTEGLGVRHLRLVLGNSMGGMHSWIWGEAFPGFMDGLVPMASQPTAMASRNWMLRRMLIETLKRDPDFHDGNYTTQPPALRTLNVLFGIATNGGTLAYQKLGGTHDLADRYVDAQLAGPPPADANDFLYQWDASRDYDPAPRLGRITAPVLAINSADDERNPPETGLMAAAMRQLHDGHLYLIPASEETRGHGTTGLARFWAEQLRAFLLTLPPL